MNTNVECPRCGQWLAVDAAGPKRIACPRCLGEVVIHDAPQPVVPLDYATGAGDVNGELRRDLSAAIWGIAAFAGLALIALLGFKYQAQIHLRDAYIVGWVAFATGLIALGVLMSHFQRRQAAATGLPFQLRTRGERAASILVLGVAGVAFALVSIVAAAIAVFVLLILTCGGALKGI